MTETKSLVLLCHHVPLLHPAYFQAVLALTPPEWTITETVFVPRPRSLRRQLRHTVDAAGWPGAVQLGARATFAGHNRLHRAFADHGVAVTRAPSANDASLVERLRDEGVDLVFCAVDTFLAAPILAAPRLGCLNRHAGKLPDFRGAEPVFHALLRGEKAVTVTFHQMTIEIDGGLVVWEHEEPVTRHDTVLSLYRRLFAAAAHGFWDAVANLEAGKGREVDTSDGAYYRRPTRSEGKRLRALGRRYL